MLQRIVDLSIRYRGTVFALAMIMLAYGIYRTDHAKLDVFPEFVQPQATIQTEAPGFSPEQVEMVVTRPVETSINSVLDIDSVRSQSIQGLSIVSVFFKEGTDIFRARQMLTEQLSTIAADLPAGVGVPTLNALTSSTMDLLKIGLVSDSRTLMELRTFADWTLKPRLQAVPGVAQVGIMGGEVRELQVQILTDRLAAFGLTMDDVLSAARRATGQRGAGYVETYNQRIVLQTRGQTITPEQLGDAIVSRSTTADVRLRDVANVEVAPAPMFGDVLIQGRKGVLVKLLSQYGANTMEVTERVEAALAQMQSTFATEHITLYPRLHRPATFIENAIAHVSVSLYIGAALVVIVLVLFLFNLRSAIISIMAIPLSLLGAIIVLDWLGMTLNTIALGGLAIAIGEVVDDAIIDVENIFRRLRENHALGNPRPVVSVVLDASLEVRGAVVYATFVVVLVFIPVLTMSGLQGRMFAPLGITYIAAILTSLLVALTVTPAMSCILLPGAAMRTPREPFFIHWMKSAYRKMLSGLLPWPRLTIIGGLLATAAAVIGLLQFGESFLPAFREGHFVAQVSAVPGTSLPAMIRIGREISDDLLKNVTIDGKPAIATVEFQAGRAAQSEDPWGPHRSELHIELIPGVPGEQQASVHQQIRDRLQAHPGLTSEVVTFLGDRISETISGETASVVVNVFGQDLDQLDQQAAVIAATLGRIPGATDIHVASPPGMPLVIARLRHDRMSQLGVRDVDALADVQTAYEGEPVAQTYQGTRVTDVRVILDEAERRQPETIGSLPLRSADGSIVPLRAIADIEPQTGRYMILHEGARRRQTVLCNVEGRDVRSFTTEAEKRVSALKMPAGVYIEFSGEAEAATEARNELLLHSSVVGIGVIMLLALILRPRELILVLANLPFALVGGVVAVALTGSVLSIGSIVGFVTLFGISMRNSLMLISHLDHLETHEGETWGVHLVLRGASERLVPVMMTALVTGLGLLPIALGSGEVGREIEGPLAIVILGGLVSSTALTLLILPTLSLHYGRKGYLAANNHGDANGG